MCRLTWIMLHQFLNSFKLTSCGDIISTIIKLPYLVMLNMVTLWIIPVSDGQRVCSWWRKRKLKKSVSVSVSVLHKPWKSGWNEEGDLPFVVSLSLIKKVPLGLFWPRSCLSASLRPILPKYHLQGKHTVKLPAEVLPKWGSKS